MLFKHFVATRFNLRIGNWETTKYGERLLSREWMKDRFRLFETYCLPSVLNQSSKNFTWCIFFDTETVEEDRRKIRLLTENQPNIEVFYIDGVDELRSRLTNYIRSVTADARFVITSRLDTDDLLHRDYVKTVQEMFSPKHNTVIDLRSGYQVSMERNTTRVRNFNNAFNQFVSLVEESGNVETIFSKWHRHWEDWERVTVYDQKRLWIEMVHHNNFVNASMPGLAYPVGFNEADFGTNGKIRLNKDAGYYAYFLKKEATAVMRSMKGILKSKLQV